MPLPLIMAGAQLVGGAVNAISTHRANKRNEENWRKQSVMNSAASQASRLRAAGLAPYAAISQIAANNKVDRAPDQMVSKFGEMIGNAGSAFGQGSQIDSEITSKEFDNALKESQARLNDFLRDVQEWQLHIDKLTESSTIDQIRYSADRARIEYNQALRQWIDDLTYSSRERASVLANQGFINAGLQFDLFMKKQFDYSFNMIDLLTGVLTIKGLQLQNIGLDYANQYDWKVLRDYDKQFGEDYWKQYSESLTSNLTSYQRQIVENAFWNEYWTVRTTPDDNGLYHLMSPKAQVDMDYKSWKRNRVNQTVSTWTGAINTATSIASQARAFRPSTISTTSYRYNRFGDVTGKNMSVTRKF